jgi:hypothetical protein
MAYWNKVKYVILREHEVHGAIWSSVEILWRTMNFQLENNDSSLSRIWATLYMPSKVAMLRNNLAGKVSIYLQHEAFEGNLVRYVVLIFCKLNMLLFFSNICFSSIFCSWSLFDGVLEQS